MGTVSKIAEGIYKIDAQLAQADRHSISFLIAGNPAALIDNGPAITIPAMLEGLHQIGQDPKQIAYILPTHIHLDHAGGSGTLARMWPWAKVLFHKQGVRHMTDPSRLIASTRKAFGENFEEVFGPILPVPESQVMVVKGGEFINLGKRELKVIYSPGHAPHHICFFQPHDHVLFCGEALGLPWGDDGKVIPTAIPPGFDLELTLDTYDKLEKLSPSVLIYSHDGASRAIGNTIQAVRIITRRLGDIILAGMKKEKEPAKIYQTVEKHMEEDGFSDVPQITSMVDAYIMYYKKKGI